MKKQVVDKHALYLASVQDPVSDVERISKIYSQIFKKKAISFREDFSGTFALSCCWVCSDAERTAISIDIDRETIEYGQNNYLKNLSTDEQSRMDVILGDAIQETTPVDITATFNFSYCLLHERSTVLKYFKAVYNSTNEKGMFILDTFGGSDSEIPEIQERDIDNNEYISDFIFQFERKSFNPINRHAHFGIHFLYPNGPQLNDAFTYHFRMWSIPELKDLLLEAGFSKVIVYWEGFDEEGLGNGEFFETKSADNSVNWNAYIVAVK